MAEIVLRVCDVCAKREDRTEAVDTIRITIDDKPMTVDLCEEHGGELTRVIAVIKEVGTIIEPPKPKRGNGRSSPRPRASNAELLKSPGATGCPVCFKLLSTPGNAVHHIKKIHLRKPEEWTREERDQATREARKRLANEGNSDAQDQRNGQDQRHLSSVPTHEPSP